MNSVYGSKFLRELLKLSEEELNKTFRKTYGLHYEQNANLFSRLYAELKRYLNTGSVNLDATFNTFFHKLYRKMFQVINIQYSFDEKYLHCIDRLMDVIKPFGDMPNKLTTEMKLAFFATRTFSQSLSIGRSIVENIAEIGPSAECSRSIMQMTYCAHCQGLANLKPCANYCLNVMRKCLLNHRELDSEWNDYVEAILLLTNRLETSFNIESVVNPLAIRISEAIMDFQENSSLISQRLFVSCGKPRIGKRQPKARLTSLEQYKFVRTQVRPATAAGTNIDRLMQEVKRKIKFSKGFWRNLPQTLCLRNQVSGEIVRELAKECWNGTDKVREESSNIAAGIERSVFESSVELGMQNAIISQQIAQLRIITSKLSKAYNGEMEEQKEDRGM
ncbi:glypican-6-like protein [Dinothrombium tinctorium]|uniref:Glypican-6-like protein n=1 Tax=Dinothrombium tinctorium TaxID=1965070 RepID=A0A443R445_9ACAR|nr:glypican-6-like protein [Dinothrombium tinctorium]